MVIQIIMKRSNAKPLLSWQRNGYLGIDTIACLGDAFNTQVLT